MYLEYFNLKEYPFNQSLNLECYYNLSSHQEALNVLLVSLKINDGIIKITGAPGTGKTLLCRILLDKLGDDYIPIYLPNPYLSYNELLQTVADEVGITLENGADNAALSKAIFQKCNKIKSSGKRIILIFDEAQGLSNENLESIRILSNLENGRGRLVQIVLIGGLELDRKLTAVASDHFNQRITFSYTLLPMRESDVKGYVMHRLTQVSNAPNKKHNITITPRASRLIHKSTKGLPRLVNLICHKSLMLVYSYGESQITPKTVSKAIKDTTIIKRSKKWKWIALNVLLGAILLIAFITL